MTESARPRWHDPLGPDAAGRSHAEPVAPVGEALRRLAARRGWEGHLVAGDLHEQWSSIVGPQLAAHTAPLRLRGGVLVLAASTPLWAAEVRQLGRAIVARVNERLGEGTVRTVTVSVRRAKPR